MNGITKLKQLSKYQYTIPILIILLEKGRINQTYIRNELKIKNVGAIVNAINQLVEMELAETKIIGSNTKLTWLTERGEAAARLIKELVAIL